MTRNGHGMEIEEPLVPHDRATEALLMGLRLREGIDLPRIARLAGGTAPIDHDAVARLATLGLIVREGDRLRVTEAGALLLDAILPEIAACRRRRSRRSAIAPRTPSVRADTTTGPPARISCTSSARSAMPSRPKRNAPSSPANPSLSRRRPSGNGDPVRQSRAIRTVSSTAS